MYDSRRKIGYEISQQMRKLAIKVAGQRFIFFGVSIKNTNGIHDNVITAIHHYLGK